MAALTGTVAAQTSPASTALDASLKSAVERKDIPGVVALVTDKKGVIYEGAFGVADVSSGRALKTDALFRIASMTKPVTSVALMQLVEQGKIALDDPAEKYLPELKNPMVVTSFDAKTGDYQLRPASKPATVRNFLTHTSGLAYPFTSAIWRDFKPKAGEVYAFGGPMLFDPGERWHYSTSIDVVGRLVEVVSGQKLEDYFHDHIFVPLKMTDTSYNVPEAKGPRLVAQQQRDGAIHALARALLQCDHARSLGVRHVVGGVVHLQRHKNILAEIILELLARHRLDQLADHVGRGAVVPALAGVEQQRPAERECFAGARLEIAPDRAGEGIGQSGRVGQEMPDQRRACRRTKLVIAGLGIEGLDDFRVL